jgi:hypothetical protein
MYLLLRLVFHSMILFLLGVQIAESENDLILLDRIPVEEKNSIAAAREECKKAGAWPEDDYKGYTRSNLDMGLMEIDLNGDKSLDILISYERICNNNIVHGGNCSNRGCDLVIYKQVGQNKWTKVFSEHARFGFLVSLDYHDRFRLLAVSIVGGNKQCVAQKLPASAHMYCDALVSWAGQRFVFRPIR